MGERLLGGDAVELGAGAAAEGPPGGGDHEVVDLVVAHPGQGLRDRGVLGVDGEDLPGRGGAGDQVSADDEGLLVRQRETGPGAERGEGGQQADGAGDRVEDHVLRAEGPGELDDRLGARADPRRREAGGGAGRLDGLAHRDDPGGVGDDELGGAVREHLLGDEAGPGAADGEAVEGRDVPVAGEDVERLRADGAGGSQQDQAPGGGAGHGTEAITSATWSRYTSTTASR